MLTIKLLRLLALQTETPKFIGLPQISVRTEARVMSLSSTRLKDADFAKSNDTYLAGDLVTTKDGETCWPYVSRAGDRLPLSVVACQGRRRRASLVWVQFECDVLFSIINDCASIANRITCKSLPIAQSLEA